MAVANNTNRQAYNAEVKLTFLTNNESLIIAPERIKYIVIDTNYESEIMPKIYMSISVDNTLYSYLMNYRNSGSFRLVIRRKNVFSGSSVNTDIINDIFMYIPSTTNQDYLQAISRNNNSDSSYRNIIIGLMSKKIIDSLRKSFNLIYNNIDQQTLLSIALEGEKVIAQPLTYNKYYDSILIPPMSSVKEFIKYVFDTDNFYDTRFLFFKDFKYTYLLSRDGTMVPDGELNDVYIDIKSLTKNQSLYEEVDIVNGSYYLYVNPMNTNVIIPNALNNVANRLVVVDDDKDLQVLDLSINKSFNESIKQIFIRADNGSLYKNELESDNVIVEVSKNFTDGYNFTPNKRYIVSNYGSYSKYNGRYMIAAKKEYFRLAADGDFVTTTYMALRKISKTGTKDNSYITDNKVNVNPTAQVTNTADQFIRTHTIPATNK